MKQSRLIPAVAITAAALTFSSAASAACYNSTAGPSAANPLPTPSTPLILLVRAASANPLLPHPAYPGKVVTLKATVPNGDPAWTYSWNYGDGSGATPVQGLSNPYATEATHAYSPASTPTGFTAVLTVTNTSTSECSTANYSVNVLSKTQATEASIAIEEGLWYMHKTLSRSVQGSVPFGTWASCGFNDCSFYAGIDAQNIQAFEVVGFRENGDPNDPYTETVSRAMKAVLNGLATTAIANTKTVLTDPLNNVGQTFNPDTNNNGVGVFANVGNEVYQGGMYLDALVASGNPGKVVDFGPLADGARTYRTTIQDLVDWYASCQDQGQYDSFFGTNRPGGGWRYSCNSDADNSVNQWGVIGMIAAEHDLGIAAPVESKNVNLAGWLNYSQDTTSGVFGYDTSAPLWGPFATTPSGMVQLVWNKVGRGDPRWDKAETYIRDNFGNIGGSTGNLKAYTYGMFSFTKSMILHNNSTAPGGAGSGAQAITLLQSSTPGVNPIDWYGAEMDTSQPESVNNTNGIARTLINNQQPDGSWTGCTDQTCDQAAFQTAWSVIMLNRTVFQTLPVACFTATPALVANGGPIQFDAKCSFHQDTTKQIVKYEWDFYSDGITPPNGVTPGFAVGSPQVRINVGTTRSIPATLTVKLRVTDNGNPALSATYIGSVQVSNPPTPPSANAGGPYNFCPNVSQNTGKLIYAPFLLDGSRSVNSDDGKREATPPGNPPSQIVDYSWFLDPNNPNTVSLSGLTSQVRVDGTPFNYQNLAGQSFNIRLRVTNNDNLAFPSAGLSAGLSTDSTASVFVRQPTDANCSHCVGDLGAVPKAVPTGRPTSVQLSWSDTDNAQFPIHHYNVYRSANAAFVPNTQIAGANSNPLVPAVLVGRLQNPAPANGRIYFIDNGVVSGQTYYYRVTPATDNDTETCQSNLTLQVVVKPSR